MSGPWDSASKFLMRLIPQHIVTWLVPGAQYVRTLSPDLHSRNIFADGLFSISVDGQPELLHIEFQSRSHPIMPERLLKYNVLAADENDWQPVHTFVIYLRSDGRAPISPLIRRYNDGEEYDRFRYSVIEVAKIPARTILGLGLHGLYPLISLTNGGNEPEVAQQMITALTEAHEVDLLVLAYTFSGLVSGGEAHQHWFKRSFAMLDEILEESTTYQEIKNLGLLKGLEQGLQGLQQERQKRVQEQRQVVSNLVSLRFPELVTYAQPRVEAINDADVLHTLLDQLFAAPTAEEARQAIIKARAEE